MSDYSQIRGLFTDLLKADGQSDDKLPKHVYKDTLHSKLGNVYSLNKFKQKYGNSGLMTAIDINGFDSVNEQFGHNKGTEALKVFCEKLGELLQKMQLKGFRKSGTSFIVHSPNADMAGKFQDELLHMVDSLPKVGGQHKLSVSIGTGYNHDHADKALGCAKKKLSQDLNGVTQRIKGFGAEDNVSHDLLHDVPNPDWAPMLGYDDLAPHEEIEPLLDKDVQNPLKVPKEG
jgi:GGDEF domain-containing protein